MFPWENFEGMGPFSTHPNRLNNSEQRQVDRKFRQLMRAERRYAKRQRRQERGFGRRLEQWKWQRFLDGDFSGFQKEFDEVILIPAGGVLACIVVLGMFIVQLDYVDEDRYRQFMLTMLMVLGGGVLLLRLFVFYAARIWVSDYGRARIEDSWILNSRGHIEEVVIFDEFDSGEWPDTRLE